MTPWQAAGHVPLPKTTKGRIVRAEPVPPIFVGGNIPLSVRVARLLAEGPAKISELRQELGNNSDSVRRAVYKLIEAGEVRECGRRATPTGGPPTTVYALVDKGADHA